ncbi:MAG: hypothetical protein LUH63_03700 [Parabacteroides sp.]|nr:hypothetical protein [Parabacteroides sp.]
MDRNLGATTATPGASTTIGYAYQWSRKDPFPLSNNILSNELRPLYDGEGNFLRPGTTTESNSGQTGLIQKAIAHPDVFYTDNTADMTYGKWWIGADSALWADATKTMFDPCPAGWRIPSWACINSMSTNMTGYDATKGGAYYNNTGCWFQYCGYLHYMNAGIGQPGITSVYWSAKAYVKYQLTGSSWGSGGQNRNLAFGFIGRCVKE